MNTTVKSLATGDFVYFFKEGDALEDASLCSRTNIPDTSDENWTDRLIGNVESLEPTLVDDDEQKIMAPAGQTGVIATKDVVQTKIGMELKFTTNEMTRLAAQCFYRSQDLTDASTYLNPMSQVPPKGWLLVQRFDQDGQEHIVLQVWVRLKVTGGMKSGDGSILKPEWSALVLWNTNNIASL